MYNQRRCEVVHEVRHELHHKESMRRGVEWSVFQGVNIKRRYDEESD